MMKKLKRIYCRKTKVNKLKGILLQTILLAISVIFVIPVVTTTCAIILHTFEIFNKLLFTQEIFWGHLISYGILVSFSFGMISTYLRYKIFMQFNRFRKSSQNSFSSLLKHSNFKSLKENEGVLIKNWIKELSIKMDVSSSSIKVYRVKNNSYLPSIEYYKKSYCIILPLNYFALVNKYPNICKALLAHEISHIKQGDVKHWKINWILMKGIQGYFKEFIIIMLVVNLVQFLIISVTTEPDMAKTMGTYLIGISFLDVIFIIFLNLLQKLCNKQRHQSEYLADLATLVFVDSKSMINCLKKFTINPETYDAYLLHPLVEDRISNLQKYQKYLV